MKNKLKGILSAVSLLAIASFIVVGCAKDKGSNNNPYGNQYANQFSPYGTNGTATNPYAGYGTGVAVAGQVYDSAIGYEKTGLYEMELGLELISNGQIAPNGLVQPGQLSVRGNLFVFSDNQFCKLPIGNYVIAVSNQVNYFPGTVSGLSLTARHQSGEQIRIEIPTALFMSSSQIYYSRNSVNRRQYNKTLSAYRFSVFRDSFGCSDKYSVSTPF